MVVFDILTRPSSELGTAERTEVQKVARELLAKLKNLLDLRFILLVYSMDVFATTVVSLIRTATAVGESLALGSGY